MPIAAALWGCLMLLCGAITADAESYLEDNARWIVNPADPTWTCAPGSLLTGEVCHPTFPRHAAYSLAKPLYVEKLVNGVPSPRLYLYVQEWGASVGAPGSGCSGDSILLFELPWSFAGVRGGAGVTYLGTVNPCESPPYHWAITSVFKDASMNGDTFLIASRAPDGSTFNDLRLGRSVRSGGQDDGRTFSWTSFLSTTNPSLGLFGVSLQPHPTRPQVWWGFLNFNYSSTWIEVDWNVNQIRVQLTPTSWATVPVGGTLNTIPNPISPFGADLYSSRGRFEAWATIGLSRSGRTVCSGGGATAIYNENVNPSDPDQNGGGNRARGGRGTELVYRVATPDWTLSDFYQVDSTVRPVPGDYGLDMEIPGRIDFGVSTNGLYTASENATICSYDLTDWIPWSGSGILFTNLTRHDGTDFYTLPPCRVYDSRTVGQPLADGSERAVRVSGVCNIPGEARAVALNVTAVSNGGYGDIRAYASSQVPTNTTVVSFGADQARAVLAILPVAVIGYGDIYFLASMSGGSADLIVDVTGYFR